MTTRLLFLKSGLKLGANQVIVQACSFIRNVVLARLISPENFGIAATLAMTFHLFEMASNLSIEALLVQAEDGNEARFQKTAQLLRAIRGLINASLIFVLAGPLSGLFGVPDARWAFQCVALVPAIRGFTHLDLNRLQREMKFGPAVINDIVSNALVTLGAFPLALSLRDFSAMLWLLIAQAAFTAIGSHLVAERRYGWAWDLSYIKRMSSFGWPLLVNGLLMFVIFDGDRFVIASAQRLFSRSTYSLTDLGVYSVAFALTMAPATMIAGVYSSLFLPLLSRVQTLRSQFERRYAVCCEAITVGAVLMAVLFIVAGGPFVVLIYGAKYVAAGAFIGILGGMWGLRTLRVAPTVAAMALGDTRNAMVSNIARTTALAGMLFVTWAGYGLPGIAACGLGGELLATIVCVSRLRREHAVPSAIFLRGFATFAAGTLLAGLAVWGWGPGFDWKTVFLTAVGLMVPLSLSMLLVFPSLRISVFGPESSFFSLIKGRGSPKAKAAVETRL